MKEELLKGLSEEQIAKLKECKSQEELLAVAKEEGVELTDEQLDAVSGGTSCLVEQFEEKDLTQKCPKCGSTSYTRLGQYRLRCNNCSTIWTSVLATN